jgi:hypothetical protein
MEILLVAAGKEQCKNALVSPLIVSREWLRMHAAVPFQKASSPGPIVFFVHKHILFSWGVRLIIFGTSGFKTGPAKSHPNLGKTGVFETGTCDFGGRREVEDILSLRRRASASIDRIQQ